MIKNYVFDFDGTAADSMPIWSSAMIKVLDQVGAKYPENIIEILVPLGDGKSATYMREKLGVTRAEEEIRDLIAKYTTPLYHKEVQPKAGFVDYVKLLKSSGKKVALLTASTHARIDECIRRWGIWDLFDRVLTCEDFGKPKSDITIYDDLLKVLGGEKSEIAFFDDNLSVLQTVKKAGLTAVGVFDDSGKRFVDEIKRTADKYVENFENLGLL